MFKANPYIVQVALLCNPVSWGQSVIVQYSKSPPTSHAVGKSVCKCLKMPLSYMIMLEHSRHS